MNGMFFAAYHRAMKHHRAILHLMFKNFYVYIHPKCQEFVAFYLENFVVAVFGSGFKDKVSNPINVVFGGRKVELHFILA